MMIGLHVWLKFASIFSLIFGYCAADNVYRVSRQDYPQSGGAPPVPYQQPFETRNGIYRVQRQDFVNTNDVPFSDPYSSLYANRFSKINHVYGNVSKSYTPLPKLFLPASVPRTENPYLAIGLPNYDRVMPTSNFGKEYQAKTSAPTRVTLKPKFTLYHDEKQFDDGALPALPNSPQYDSSALPSISEYSKSLPYDEDLSSLVEQFEMTEDKKIICKGVNCRTSNTNDGAGTVEPIRRKRSIEYDYDPYYSYKRRPNYWNDLEYDSDYAGHSTFSKPSFYNHDHVRAFSYINQMLKNHMNRDETTDETSSYEPATTENNILSEETEQTSSADVALDDENTSISNDAEILSSNEPVETTLPEFSTESSAEFDPSGKKVYKYVSIYPVYDFYHPHHSHNRRFYHYYNRRPYNTYSRYIVYIDDMLRNTENHPQSPPEDENIPLYNDAEISSTGWIDETTTIFDPNLNEIKDNIEFLQSLIWTEDTFESTPVSTETPVNNNQFDFNENNNNKALPFDDLENNPELIDDFKREVTSDADDSISSTGPSVDLDQNNGSNDTPIECEFYLETTNSEISPEVTEGYNSVTDDDQNNVKTSSTTEISGLENENNNYDSLLTNFEAIINWGLDESMSLVTITGDDLIDNHAVYSTEPPIESVESNQNDGTNYSPTENEFYSETSTTESNFKGSIDTTQSTADFKNNLEITTADTAVPEEHTVYFPTGSDEQLLEYRFRIAFVCTMWPDLYQKSKFKFYDAEMKNMYYLCNFYNALNKHIETPSDTYIKYEDEPEVNTTEKPAKGDFREWLIQMFINSVDETSELDKDNGIDSSLPSYSTAPVVYSLRNF